MEISKKKKKKSTKRSQLPKRRADIKYSIDINSNDLSVTYGCNSHIHRCACGFWLNKREKNNCNLSNCQINMKKKKLTPNNVQ